MFNVHACHGHRYRPSPVPLSGTGIVVNNFIMLPQAHRTDLLIGGLGGGGGGKFHGCIKCVVHNASMAGTKPSKEKC